MDRAPPDLTERYNTALTPDEELAYQNWAQIQSALQNRDVNRDLFNYDLRGAFKSGATQSPNGHLPDTFKKPNHPSFSDQSQYHGVDGFTGGSWRQIGGQWVFTPGQTNLQLHGPAGLQQYFQQSDPNVRLNTPASPMLSMLDYVRQQMAQGDAPWTNNLKRLVNPSIDPNALVPPPDPNTDPGLNRTGPRVGDVLTA